MRKTALVVLIASLLLVSGVAEAQWSEVSGNVVYGGSGSVGIGTTNPGGLLDVKGQSGGELMLRVWNSGAGGAKMRFVAADGQEAKYQATHGSGYTSEIAANLNAGNQNNNYLRFRVRGASDGNSEAGLAAADRMTILGNGNIGIGTTAPAAKLDVVGNVNVSGSITANSVINAVWGSDIAEWVPSTTAVKPGTVVILNPSRTNEVMTSQTSYDTTVAGVVSEQPGLVLGRGGDGKAAVATSGRVRVRVDARNNPIKIGDLLVTSDVPGTAMKSEPMNVNGRKFHQPGTIIGKALEPLADGEGMILALLSLE